MGWGFQRRAAVGVLMTLGLIAAPATAQVKPAPLPSASPPTADELPIIITPSWLRPPSPEFPEPARINGVRQARVVLQCLASATGALSNCTVVEETPADHGFGEATILAARRARLSPLTVEGVPVRARVRFVTNFVLPEDLLEPSAPPPAQSNDAPFITSITPAPAPTPKSAAPQR